MLKAGDTVKWMCPLDNDYTYGEIVGIKRSIATVKGIGLYRGITAEVHLKFIELVQRGGGGYGGCKGDSKRSTT